MSSLVRRFERIDFVEDDLASPQKTSDGYWRLEGKVARVGVQEYRRADGTVIRELRLPEDVKASAAGFALLPLTNGHPPGMVTPDNAKKYAVGAVGEAEFSGQWIKAPMTVWSADAIASIKAGRAQLSAGYQCMLVEEPGEWEGQKYDCRQTAIVPNHLALVDVARAGPEARLRLDAGDAICESGFGQRETDVITSNPRINDMTYKFKVDGMEFNTDDANAPGAVDRAIAKQAERADAAEKAIEAVKKELAETKVKLDVSEAKVTEQGAELATFDGKVRDFGMQLAALHTEAGRILGTNVKLDGLSMTEIRKLVVAKLSPGLKVDGYGDGEMKIAYDSLVSAAPKPAAAIDLVQTVHGAPQPKADGMPSSNPQEARERMVQRLREQSQRAQLVK